MGQRVIKFIKSKMDLPFVIISKELSAHIDNFNRPETLWANYGQNESWLILTGCLNDCLLQKTSMNCD